MEVVPFTNISVWLVVKIFAIVALLVYLVFALVVVRQIQLMTQAFKVGLEKTLRSLSYAHLLFAIAVLLAALIVL